MITGAEATAFGNLGYSVELSVRKTTSFTVGSIRGAKRWKSSPATTKSKTPPPITDPKMIAHLFGDERLWEGAAMAAAE